MVQQIETRNDAWLLFFTDQRQVYKCRAADFADTKASVMGEFVAASLGMDEGELPVYMAVTLDYKGYMLFAYANGKFAKIPMNSYATKQNRKKLRKAYSDKEQLACMVQLPEETELAVRTSGGRMLLAHTTQIAEKQTRDTAGVAVITLKKNQHIEWVKPAGELELANPHRYRVRSLPAAGALVREEDVAEQLQLGQ